MVGFRNFCLEMLCIQKIVDMYHSTSQIQILLEFESLQIFALISISKNQFSGCFLSYKTNPLSSYPKYSSKVTVRTLIKPYLFIN